MLAGVGNAERSPMSVRLAGRTAGEPSDSPPRPAGSPVTPAGSPVTPAPSHTATPDAATATAATPTAAGIAPGVVRLRLGRFDAPATDAVARIGVPDGVPVTPGFAVRNGARSLSLTREGVAPFRAVGVTWTGPAAGVSVAVRSRTGGQEWGTWHTAEPTGGFDGAGPGVRQGAQLIWLGSGDAVDVIVTATGAAIPDDVTVDLIDPREAPGDAVTVPPVTSTAVDATRVARPPIHSRAEWGADELLMTWPPQYARTVQALSWHEEAIGGDYAETDVPRILRALFYYDAVSRGWGDLGDNVLVDRFGRLWEGRYGGLSRPVVGAHTPARNVGTAGIGMLGGADSRAGTAAIEAAAHYVAWKLSIGPAVDPRGHTTLSGTATGLDSRPAQPTLAASKSTKAKPAIGSAVTVPRVFSADARVASGVLQALRERAYVMMGAWAKPQTMRRTLAVWSPTGATLTELGDATPTWTGQPGDVPVVADYDGDGQLDVATWTPSSGVWRIRNSAAGTTETFVLGGPDDIPVPADYDGDGRADPATFTPSTATWHVRGAADVVYGKPGDQPVPADYTGDGRADLAVYRAKAGRWEIRGVGKVYLGSAWHIPVPADYNGDGKAEPATFSPKSGLWYFRGREPVRFGKPGDVPVPAQYDGDGKADLAVWRPPAHHAKTGTWLIRGAGSYPIGTLGDMPTPVG
ncbi:hypothetical protein HC031_17560 [Planosporangium thailandense]|uniref:Peptidoglycan recognition protein family domain-containing protein n=1 Tax=Planosporangium thailandense TaxID=765197 RepID=A0ABX0XZL5_9ACTN|nr:hypothetical protein [Planosporangium thailandense]NJC71511.1 hypothetical protein [Planosporangium thailandense]